MLIKKKSKLSLFKNINKAIQLSQSIKFLQHDYRTTWYRTYPQNTPVGWGIFYILMNDTWLQHPKNSWWWCHPVLLSLWLLSSMKGNKDYLIWRTLVTIQSYFVITEKRIILRITEIILIRFNNCKKNKGSILKYWYVTTHFIHQHRVLWNISRLDDVLIHDLGCNYVSSLPSAIMKLFYDNF